MPHRGGGSGSVGAGLGRRVRAGADGLFVETSMFGNEFKGDGRYTVVGPSPDVRKWYANVFVKDGAIAKVT